MSPLIFADIEKQIKAIYDLCYISGSVNLENDIQLSNEVLFSHRSEKGSNANIIEVGTDRNLFDFDGQPLQSYICKSIMHFSNNCPNKSDAQKNFDDTHSKMVFSSTA